ncbi:MAG: LysE family transporter, partial [Archaeoglobaceae archaeon]
VEARRAGSREEFEKVVADAKMSKSKPEGVGYLTLKSALGEMGIKETKFHPFLTGILLTALNPFFIIWWFSVGSALVAESTLIFGSMGVIVLLFSHVWIDFAWLSTIAYVTSLKGIIAKIHKLLLIFFGFLVIFFGVDYLHFAILNSHLLSL